METKRLLINELIESDKEDFFINICHDKKVLETFMCKYQESLETFDFKVYLRREDIFAIRLKNNKLIGILTIFDKKENSIEIGYAIGSNYWNNGYMSEAVKCFVDYLFSKGNSTVIAGYFEGNIASKKVMEKVDFKYSHTIDNELVYLDKPRNVIYYKITK